MAITPLIIGSPVYQAFHPTTGAKLAGGKLYHYEIGTETTKALYTTYTAKSPYAHANPIVLDADGKATIYGSGSYDFYLYDASDNLIEGPKRVTIIPVSDFALTLLDDTSATAMRATLGLGTAATKDTGTGAGNVLIFVTSDTLPALDGSLLTGFTDAQKYNTPWGYRWGLGITISSPTATSFSIAAGACRNDDNDGDITAATAISKTNAAWVVATGQGGLATGTIASTLTWYDVYLIYKPASGEVAAVTDAAFVLAGGDPLTEGYAPQVAGFTKKRFLHSVRVNASGAFLSVQNFQNKTYWDAPVLDVTAQAFTATATDFTLASIPTGRPVIALLNVRILQTAGTANDVVYFHSPNITDAAASVSAAPLGQTSLYIQNGSTNHIMENLEVLTNDAAQISVQTSTGGSGTVSLAVLGWIDDWSAV